MAHTQRHPRSANGPHAASANGSRSARAGCECPEPLQQLAHEPASPPTDETAASVAEESRSEVASDHEEMLVRRTSQLRLRHSRFANRLQTTVLATLCLRCLRLQNSRRRLNLRKNNMATLEEITRGAAVKGILPDGLVSIIDVRWIGTVAIRIDRGRHSRTIGMGRGRS